MIAMPICDIIEMAKLCEKTRGSTIISAAALPQSARRFQ
jgi:hypothetical protein